MRPRRTGAARTVVHNENGMIDALIQRARTRLVLNEALAQTAFAAAVFAGGVALVLIVGTRLLEWWPLAFFGFAGAVAGLWRGWRAVPTLYAVAVKLDENAGLADSLSTALHFTSHESGSPEFEEAQRRQAENAARSVDLALALPFTMPRAVYAMAGLAVLASSLFILRYTMGKGLDLKAPITEVLFEDLAAGKVAKQSRGYMDPLRRSKLEAAESLLAKLGVPINPDEKEMPDAALDKAIEDALDTTGPRGEKGAKGEGGKADDGKAGNGLDKAADGDPMDGKKSDGAADQNQGQSPSGQQGTPGDKGNSKTGNGENSSSLLSKLKDAVQNMLSKGQEGKSGGQKQQGQQQQQQAKSDKAGEKGSSGKGQEQQGQEQNGAQEGEANGESQEGQQAEGKAGSKSAQQSAQSGSGVGSQDGAKELRAAEQLKAMGKISEIIGKRAATVTGETTIEVQSGNQQLRTAYSDKSATHSEADSDVSRDEIPVALQSYVQQYFQQVRKPAAPAPAKAKSEK